MDRAGQPIFPRGPGSSVVGAPGDSADLAEVRAPVQPAASCGSRSTHPRREPARPILFEQKVLAPGPQPKHPGNVKL
jgi:hypothetical protein